MARNVEYARPYADTRNLDFVALRQLSRDAGNVLGCRPEYRYVILRQEIDVAADMICVVMGIEYRGKLQALGAQVIDHGPGIAGIHDCGIGAASQAPDIVVLERTDWSNSGHFHGR